MSLLVGALVARQQLQAVLAQSIDAGIANMRQPGVVFIQQQAGERRAHALLVALSRRAAADPPSGAEHRLAQQFASPIETRRAPGETLAKRLVDRVGGDPRRERTGVVATHAVGDQQQTEVRMHPGDVFIERSDAACIAQTHHLACITNQHRRAS